MLALKSQTRTARPLAAFCLNDPSNHQALLSAFPCLTVTRTVKTPRRRSLNATTARLKWLASLKDRKPTPDVANRLSLSMPEMDNNILLTLGALDHHEAHKELLKRHIMKIDHVSYDEASLVYKQIEHENNKGMYLLALPYQIGIAIGTIGAFASIPLVFHHATAHAFNERFVTTDVPEPKDLETVLEVGAWTWNWMEPVLGQVSFFLLCLQFSRAQLNNLGYHPYTRKMKQMRGIRLAQAFPKYDSRLLIQFSESSKLYKKI
jgi:hypothetical protein